MTERVNADLANILGNLVNRTISMSNKYFGGIVEDKGVSEAVDEDLKKVATETYAKVCAKMEDLRAADAITEIFTLFKRCNTRHVMDIVLSTTSLMCVIKERILTMC